MRKITPQLRRDLQIAAETIIIGRWVREREHPEEGQSSRVFADEIVDMVLDTIEEKRPSPSGDELKPWQHFACCKKD